MVFLIQYNRKSGQIVSRQTFEDIHRQKAQNARLALELDLNARNIDSEVVLLEAASEEAVRRTHRRYFESLSELTSPSTH